MKITEEKLAETYKNHKEQYRGRKEDYFAPLFIAEKHGKNIDAVLNNCSFGNNDYGIDAYYIDKEAKNLYLYQFKWSDKFEGFKKSYERLINKGIERIFGNPLADPDVSDIIPNLQTDIREFKDLIKNVYIRFVFNGDVEKAKKSPSLENLKEKLELKYYIIHKYFGNNAISFIDIEYLSNEGNKNKRQIFSNKKPYQYNILFESQSKKSTEEGTLYLGFINLFDLYNMHIEMKQNLFEKNIRFGLDASRHKFVYRAIKKSFKDIIIDKKTSPEYFTFHHSGITIFAEEFELEPENGRAKIIEPRILNGAQTITILSDFIEEHPDRKEYINTLKEIKVIGKIITSHLKDFVTQVTISNNKQNPVKAWNLRANDDIQLEFAEKFNEKSIFYERQENSFKNYHNDELEDLEIDITLNKKPIKVTKLAQTFLAFQGEIDDFSDLNEIFGDDERYKKTFKESYLKADIRKIIIAYKIGDRLRAIIDYIKDQGSSYSFIGRAKPLIWALAIQGFLNKCDNDFIDSYGNDLKIPVGFIDNFKSDIWRIFSHLIKEREKDIREGNFKFLSEKETFLMCMEIAKAKGWKRQKLDS